jgi:hypothetical protein
MGRPLDSARTMPSITPSLGRSIACTSAPLKGQRTPPLSRGTGSPAWIGPLFPPCEGARGPNRRRASVTIASSRSAAAASLRLAGWGLLPAGSSCAGAFSVAFTGAGSSGMGRGCGSAAAGVGGGGGRRGCTGCGGLGFGGASLGCRYIIWITRGCGCAGCSRASSGASLDKLRARSRIAACPRTLANASRGWRCPVVSCSHSANGARRGLPGWSPRPKGCRPLMTRRAGRRTSLAGGGGALGAIG